MANPAQGSARRAPLRRLQDRLRRGMRGRGARIRLLRPQAASPIDSRVNSTTALRLLMAVLVIYGHSHILGGFGENLISRVSQEQISIGELAVAGFFFISGLFITKSFTACGSLWRYLMHRAVRILPGYWTCLLLYVGFSSPVRHIVLHADLSYGMYIYAFPVQQLLALLGVNSLGFGPFCLSGIAVTLPVACLSWYVVEQPCLQLKDRFPLPSPWRPKRRSGRPESRRQGRYAVRHRPERVDGDRDDLPVGPAACSAYD